jgi:hypothetical protein
LCPCGHAFIYPSSYFSRPLSCQLLFYSNYFICPKQEPRFIFETKLLSKLSIYKIIGTYKVGWSHYFTNLYFVDVYKKVSNTFMKTFKGDAMSPLVSEKSTKALLLYLKTLSYLTMA